MAAKSNGQKLYEHRHPKLIKVFRSRAPWSEALMVQNPDPPVPWELLTERFRQSYETEARTHHLFQGA